MSACRAPAASSANSSPCWARSCINSWVAIFAATGVILSAAYALYLYRRVIFGALVKPALQTIQDLSLREIAILAPLVVITIAMGIYPKPVFDVTTPSVAKLIARQQDGAGAAIMRTASVALRRRRERPVNLQADLLVLLPELILAVGAMALLLAGAIGGEKSCAGDLAWRHLCCCCCPGRR